jgi:hypothetical protein
MKRLSHTFTNNCLFNNPCSVNNLSANKPLTGLSRI